MSNNDEQVLMDIESRRVEAVKIVDIVMATVGYIERLDEKDLRLIMSTRERLLKYGSNAFISLRQLFYLRDVKDKLL